MRLQIFLWTFLVLLSVPIGTKAAPQSAGSQRVTKTVPGTCPVTLPRKRTAPIDGMSFFEPGTSRSKPTLSVGLYPDGTVVFQPGGPGFIGPDGALSMKFWWTRGEGLRGKLRIHGKRLDAPAPPLRADIPEGTAIRDFKPLG
jgi:hypothetical protein